MIAIALTLTLIILVPLAFILGAVWSARSCGDAMVRALEEIERDEVLPALTDAGAARLLRAINEGPPACESCETLAATKVITTSSFGCGQDAVQGVQFLVCEGCVPIFGLGVLVEEL